MKGRVMRVTLKAEAIDEAARRWPGYAANFKGRGLEAMYLLVDRESGKAMSVTIWEDEGKMKANEGRADVQDALRSFEPYYADAPSWSYFDVAAKLV